MMLTLCAMCEYTNNRVPFAFNASPAGPSGTLICCALLGEKPAVEIEAVGSAATFADPSAATYSVSPLGLNTIAVGCDRLRALSAALIA